MIVVMTSWAPVWALRKPGMPPQMAPHRTPPSSASTTCTTGGRSSVKPTQAAPIAPRMIWPSAPMLNRPARKARPTERPAAISGTAKTSDSVKGRKAALAVLAVGSTIAPWNNATYALETASHAARSVSPGAAKRYPAASWTSGSATTMSTAPTARASSTDSAVSTTVSRSWRPRPTAANGWSAGAGGGGAGAVVVPVTRHLRTVPRGAPAASVRYPGPRPGRSRLSARTRPPPPAPPQARRRPSSGRVRRATFPVGQAEHLVQLGRADQHRCAPVALGHDPVVQELDRPDVDAARGLRGHEQLQRPGQLAGHDQLLLVAAGKRRRGRVDALGADVELLDQVDRVAPDLGWGHRDAAGERRTVVPVQHEVLGHAERPDQAVVGAVLRHVSDALVEDLLGRLADQLAPVKPDRTRHVVLQS